jgi:hypothetical protein
VKKKAFVNDQYYSDSGDDEQQPTGRPNDKEAKTIKKSKKIKKKQAMKPKNREESGVLEVSSYSD